MKLIEDQLSVKYRNLCKAKNDLERIQQEYYKAEEAYWKARKEYKETDRSRALIDGRLTVLKPVEESKPKKKKPRDLNKEEILAVAQKLGINISINF